ncbi:pyridoxal-phosphate dependent enzyme, partial [Enterococcus spodopteracolus]
IDSNYAILANDEFKNIFSNYSIAVGSTGNLGLSVGIMGAKLGFQTTVHMSNEAKSWKKRLLREMGVVVKEYEGDFSKAVALGRA